MMQTDDIFVNENFYFYFDRFEIRMNALYIFIASVLFVLLLWTVENTSCDRYYLFRFYLNKSGIIDKLRRLVKTFI